MIERRALRFEAGVLTSRELPSFVATGAGDGPHLALIAGIHGCEYSSIAAVTRFMRELDTGELRGRITAVPIVNLGSFHARSPFVVPEDGKNPTAASRVRTRGPSPMHSPAPSSTR